MPTRTLRLLLCGLTLGYAAQLNITTDNLGQHAAQYLPEAYAKANFTLADAQRLLRQKCERANVKSRLVVNVTVLSTNIEAAAQRLLQCGNSLVNLTQILEEMEQARPNGDLDVVFEKYCSRLPQAESCLLDFNSALLPCLTQEERVQNGVLLKIIKQLMAFVCYKNGDQIALFIAEEGPECLEQSREHIASCLNTSFAGYLPAQLEHMELPDLLLGPKQCLDLHDFEKCVLTKLEQCNTITPSNIVESLFRFVRRESQCQAEIELQLRQLAAALASNETISARDAAVCLQPGGIVSLLLYLVLAFWLGHDL